MRLVQTAAPTAEPVSIEAARKQCAVVGTKHDAILAGFVSAAREAVENYTERALCDAAYEFRTANTCDGLWLPRPQIGTVTSISYVDAAGALVGLSPSAYSVDSLTGKVSPVAATWPWGGGSDVRAAYRTAPGYVPAALISAILLIVADLFATREATIVGTIVAINPALERLMRPHRIGMGV